MTTNTEMNTSKLKEIAVKSKSATEVALSFIDRQRARPSTDIRRLKGMLARQGHRIDGAEYSQFWKDLQAAGIGSIIYGRRGNPNRFEWRYNLRKVAEAMLEGGETPKPLPKPLLAPPRASNEVLQRPSLPSPDQKMIIVLSDGRHIDLTIPTNLSKAEATAIANAIAKVSR